MMSLPRVFNCESVYVEYWKMLVLKNPLATYWRLDGLANEEDTLDMGF